jgi:hypothetical protein
MFKSRSRIQIFRDTTSGNVFFLRDEVKNKKKYVVINESSKWIIWWYFIFIFFFKQYKTITIKDRRISLSSSLIIVYNLSFVRRKWRRLELYRMVFPVRIRTYRIKNLQIEGENEDAILRYFSLWHFIVDVFPFDISIFRPNSGLPHKVQNQL